MITAGSDSEKVAFIKRAPRISNRPRALVFNQYLQTAGGGERLCFEVAAALERAGYEVEFVIAAPIELDVVALARAFGIKPKGHWHLWNVDCEARIAELCKREGFEIFVNNTYNSFLYNPAPIGIYVSMFPQRVSTAEQAALATYSFVQCISNFTELYTLRRWKTVSAKVIVPPISEVHFTEPRVSFAEKEKLILCIGRFNVRGHSKCQLEAIRAFVRMQSDGALDRDWQFVVAGRVNDGDENLRYLGECLAAASAQVSVIENLPLEEMCKLYRKASVLWQFTGLGKDFGFKPEVCEHLGLVALDCFAYGALPVVYQRGGMPYFIDQGINGYNFGTIDELASIMSGVASNFGNQFHRFQFEHSLKSAERFSFDVFAASLREFIDEAKAANSRDAHGANALAV